MVDIPSELSCSVPAEKAPVRFNVLQSLTMYPLTGFLACDEGYVKKTGCPVFKGRMDRSPDIFRLSLLGKYFVIRGRKWPLGHPLPAERLVPAR